MSPRLKSAVINAHAAFLALAVIGLITACLEIKPFYSAHRVVAFSRSGERVASYRSDTGLLSLLELNTVVGTWQESITIPDVLTSWNAGPLKLQFIGNGDTHLLVDDALVSLEDYSVGSLKGHAMPSHIPFNEIRADSRADSFHVVAFMPVKVDTFDLTPDFTRNTFTTPAAAKRENFSSFSNIKVFEIRNRNRIASSKGDEFFSDANGNPKLLPNFGFVVMDLDRNETLYESREGDFLGFCGNGDFCVVASPGDSPESLEVWQISTGKRVASHEFSDPVAFSDDRLIVLEGSRDLKVLSLPDLEETVKFRPPFEIPPETSSLRPSFNRFVAAEIVPGDILRIALHNGEIYDLDLTGENEHRRVSDLWRSRGEKWSLIALAGLGLGILIAALVARRTRNSTLFKSEDRRTATLRFATRSIWIIAGLTITMWWLIDTAWTTTHFDVSLSDRLKTLLRAVPGVLWMGALSIGFLAVWRLLIWPLSRVWNHPPKLTDSRFHFGFGLAFGLVATVAFYFR